MACVREMTVESWHQTAGAGVPPSLKNITLLHSHAHNSGKGKVRKCCEVAGMAVQIVVSAVLGDPTVLIAGIVGSLVSRA